MCAYEMVGLELFHMADSAAAITFMQKAGDLARIHLKSVSADVVDALHAAISAVRLVLRPQAFYWFNSCLQEHEKSLTRTFSSSEVRPGSGSVARRSSLVHR